ncbi:lysosomal thioesterase PPT2-A-like isoform X2 [Ostrea edulis]|uniref:lysosomal thioesterase PPT2-A-like isoform X2 n=1 Tax=Ostrea edulis TaxID=37623 RepID=UPI0020944481|nr:lysosomal thioesterase PPT2-A-like isoform X2 [Ostrea edulis]
MLLVVVLQFSVLAFITGASNISNGPKAVVFIHGIFGYQKDGMEIQQWVEQVHPDTPFYSIALYEGSSSLAPLWKQVDAIRGLICRGILSRTQHNVDTFIALSSPLAGQYGDTKYMKHLFPNLLKSEAYRVFYTKEGQKLSIGNYWKDPHQLEKYTKYCNFLASLNNDTYTSEMNEYKQNFLRLNRLILIGGPDDGVITPWESSHFAFYDSQEKVVELEQQRYFLDDSFGLQTLFNQKKIKTYTISGVAHNEWPNNRTVFSSAILPWLI